ncbi:hypothetical protein [Paenibacillus thiaminolyticus]|uniref:Uncharacterized protein n=1 Tax=Paenibacillus thiaminolyticus TaxID=49283 RepID=A0A3A3GHX3_PANTH|nr:hypothetical protein [Paenibacillus thiaminolyticus]RJG21756.1 hypothetical protein DQX05_20355 [Paenibacillus thiaminolyticus]
MKRLVSRFLMQSNSDRYDDEEKSGNYTRWVNGELYLDSEGNSGSPYSWRLGAASLRVLENSGRLKVKREGGQVAMPFERYGSQEGRWRPSAEVWRG